MCIGGPHEFSFVVVDRSSRLFSRLLPCGGAPAHFLLAFQGETGAAAKLAQSAEGLAAGTVFRPALSLGAEDDFSRDCKEYRAPARHQGPPGGSALSQAH